MESLYILIPLSVIVVLVAAVFFFRMSRGGQFDDDQGPAWSILLDDDKVPENLAKQIRGDQSPVQAGRDPVEKPD